MGGCQSLQVSDIRRGDAYPVTDAERGRTNTSDDEIALPLEELWEYDANAGFGLGGPLVLAEFLIALNRKGEVHAVDIESGRKVGLERFGEAINGDAVLEDGVLFVPLDLRFETHRHGLGPARGLSESGVLTEIMPSRQH